MEAAGKRIVVVEDDEIILEFLEMVFATETMEVIRARDGAKGIEVAERYGPDAIVCDLHMAGMTGLEVLRQVRENPALAHIPVIILTADQNPAVKRQSLVHGADAFVLKPFDPETLIETVVGLTGQRKTGNRIDQAR